MTRVVFVIGVMVFLGMVALAVIMMFATSANAGCIGPVIMGECAGGEVPWDTHPDGERREEAPPGFYWDKRGTRDEQRYPGAINPFTGQDAHDSHWHQPQDW